MAIYQFPLSLFPAATFSIYPAGISVGSGATIEGAGQNSDWSGGGKWAGEMTGIRVSKPAQFRAWRKLCLNVDDGIDEVEIPMIDSYTWPVGDATPETMSFDLSEAAALRATTLKIRRNAGAELEGGEMFSLTHGLAGRRLYGIKSAGALIGGIQTCKIRPPLRQATAMLAAVDFRHLSCVMRCITPPKELWGVIRPPYKTDVIIRFVESFSYQDGL